MEAAVPTIYEDMMVDRKINPFHDLYVTERLGPSNYIKLFSPVLCKHALLLFKPGNVVLKGTKGNGKTMLLTLLSPETRIAYMKANMEFPIPPEFRKFIGAGINLTHSGVLDFGQRPMAVNSENEEVLPIYFGDYINSYIVLKILESIEILQLEPTGTIAGDLGLTANELSMAHFAAALASDKCWFGYLDGVTSIKDLKQRLSDRIVEYRNYLQYNINNISSQISQTKTRIGEPISNTIKHLRKQEIIGKGCHIFIKIDQLEELTRMEGLFKFGASFREIINKALGMRDPNVSYRIGSRRYAWNDNLNIYGTDAKLEEERDYKIIDIDEILRRKESRRTWIFPSFAEDVFEKRIKYAFNESITREGLINKVFGKGLSPRELAREYAGTARKRAVNAEDDWPTAWVNFLYRLAEDDPFSARLAEAWCRQREKSEVMHKIPDTKPYPWEKKQYWKKERVGHALMQIAARCGQRMMWAGVGDIVSLSGGNILAFISLCHYVWATWIRDTRRMEINNIELPHIDSKVQSVGIHEASSYWFDSIPSQPGGNSRQRFISFIGTRIFYKKMYEDKAMSQPGGNGFSLKLSELNANEDIKRFLEDAVDFGDLYDAPHTTKTKDREKRKKWYLSPMLSPYFKIPAVHTKEPLYITIKEFRVWMKNANKGIEEPPTTIQTVRRQPSLFQDD